MSASRRNGWTLAIVSVALFMVVLDNLVVSVALPTIHRDLGASIQSLEWTVNAYVLAYAVLLLTGAALGDRFGRKRMFLIGMSRVHRRLGRGGARAEHRAAGGRSRGAGDRRGDGDAAHAHAAGRGLPGAAARDGDRRVVGDQRDRRGARPARRRRGRAGHLLALDLLDQRPHRPVLRSRWRRAQLRESHGPSRTLDLPGLALGSQRRVRASCSGSCAAQSLGWGSTTVLASLIAGVILLSGFVRWELRAAEPMLPMSFFAKRSFAVTNVTSLSMYFGMFGSIFFLSQFMQNVLHNTPLQAGLKLLVWTGATMLVAPFAGVFSERFGSRPFMIAGLSLQAGAPRHGWRACSPRTCSTRR